MIGYWDPDQDIHKENTILLVHITAVACVIVLLFFITRMLNVIHFHYKKGSFRISYMIY